MPIPTPPIFDDDYDARDEWKAGQEYQATRLMCENCGEDFQDNNGLCDVCQTDRECGGRLP